MNVRLTTDNLLTNPLLELIKDNNTPYGWFTYVNGDAIKGEWVLDTTQTLYYPNNITFVDKQDDFFSNVKVQKSASVKGEGIYKNIPAIEHTLTSNYKTYTDSIGDTQVEKQDRYVVPDANKQIFIKELSTKIIIEVSMLRKPNFTDNPNRTLHVLKNTTGRELAVTGEYKPLSTTLDFVECKSKSDALATFFKTAIKYKAGFTLEAFLKPTDEQGWGGDSAWGPVPWGGLDPNGQWVRLFHLDVNNYSLNRASTTGNISVNCVLQKSEVNNVM